MNFLGKNLLLQAVSLPTSSLNTKIPLMLYFSAS